MKHSVILIPPDNRPVSYDLPYDIGNLNTDLEVKIPPIDLLGGLHTPADIHGILSWLAEELKRDKNADVICCLDTIAYGGIIPSRNIDFSKEHITHNLDSLKNIISAFSGKKYAFSSIMRISDSNVNEEEKEYWDEFGKLIFKYSFLTHKKAENKATITQKQELESIAKQIPQEILNDYLQSRERNFSFNRLYLNWVNEKLLDYLVYGRDDTARYGMNVQEAEFISNEIKDKNLSEKCAVITGADEIISVLLTKILLEKLSAQISIYPVFSTENGSNIIPRYEEKKVYDSILEKFKILGLKLAKSAYSADMILLVNTPKERQNDLALGLYYEPDNAESVEFCIELIKNSEKPVILADIFSANGADNMLVQQILFNYMSLDKLYGYSGWNTAGNTIGSALAIGVTKFVLEKDKFNEDLFKKIMLVRFADDWAYQTIVRQKIRLIDSELEDSLLESEFLPYVKNIAKKIDIRFNKLKVYFPWERSFEVKIEVL